MQLFKVNLLAILTVIGGRGLLAQNIPAEGTHEVTNNIEAIDYFHNNGWTGGTGEVQSIITPDKLTKLLVAFQTRYNLPITGDLNEETKQLMSSPRCGNPDFGPEGFDGNTRKRRFTRLGTTIWDTRNVVTWFIENQSDLADSDVEAEMVKAFELWDSASDITLVKAQSAASADIKMSFQRRSHGDGNTFDGPSGTLAHAFSPGRGLGGDVHFDNDEEFSIGEGTDLHQVATHEIGHSLGLGHSDNINAVMAPFYNYNPNFKLHADDVNGVVDLYGLPSRQPRMTLPPNMPTAKPTTQAPSPTPAPPVYCNIRIDAVANSFDGGLYFFQGIEIFKVYQINGEFAVADGYPKYIWDEFPGVYTGNIDAAVLFAYYSGDRVLYIFRGDRYWRIDNGVPLPGYPKSITAIWAGIPANIDAAFFWTGNNNLYFFKDNEYYRYSFSRMGLDYGYPRDQKLWKNVDNNVADAVDFGGFTYFFQEQTYQQFNDRAFVAGNRFSTTSKWFGCNVQNVEQNEATTPIDDVTELEEESMLTCGTSKNINHSLTAFVCVTLTLIIGIHRF